MADPVVGRLLDGRYTAQERLAVGGMATVYVAHDNRLDRLVALKVMHPTLNHDPEFVTRFHREAKAVARLNTPRVVSILDQGSDHIPAGLVNYLVMELVRGRSLRQHLGARGRLPVTEAIEIIEPVIEALAAAHAAGIIHRDIKPENILLGDDGQVKVADFGLARPVSQPTQALTGGVVMGTVGYLAPEQVTHGVADTRSDVYAAGVVLFESLTGQLPHSGATPMSVAYQSVHGDVPAPSTMIEGIPAELDGLVLRATARDPARRPVDGAALLAELRRIEPFLPPQDAYPSGFTGEIERIGLAERPSGAREPGYPQEPGYTQPFQAEDYDDSRGAGPGAAAERAFAGAGPGQPGTGALYRSASPPSPTATAYLGGGGGRGRRRAAASPRSRGLIPVVVGGMAVLVLLLGILAFRSLSGGGTEVPLLTNLSRSDAEKMLRDAGFQFTYLDPVASATVPVGHVAQQDPRDGSKVDKGALITLRLSSGPATVRVPDLANLTETQAKARLAEVDLTLGGLSPQSSDTVPAGHVIGTNPGAGTALKPKDQVVVITSTGPATKPVPADIIGKSFEEAKAELVGLNIGLVVQRTDAVNDAVQPGEVFGVSPDVGQPISPGGTVTLTVAEADGFDNGDGSGGDGSGIQVPVPNVVGKSYREAENILQRRGLKIDRIGWIGGPGDRVTSQSAKAGSKIEKGSTVHVNTTWDPLG
ncbi:serine/threonine protein kinase [Frankia casuarinae]|uniref:Stk1 family PASTA domain-containing Ser/Thr kinase n=1 Tax=Frankia casuarinae (strain DSM 45818 / CECT 9043 / HFP020203 / CcI3) TaxID=106370 RepID=UPI00044FE496|nr:Stk1 family PASTA domain-containing Ser/Thr kinase [Frankia casuarinae]EYT91988.1 serine/threonine protein kinase [Frankia casuarinae]